MTDTLEILDKLIAFETVSNKSNLDLISFAESLLIDSGFRTVRLPAPCGTKAGLYAEIGPETEGGILLSGHTDVVAIQGQSWTKPPFRLTAEGGRFYGRGTTDMKGFVASALALARKAKTLKLNRPLAIVLSYDEEIGCVGLQHMKEQLVGLLRSPALCVVGEPTEMHVATGHKGKTSYRATFTGEAGHSALAPKFENALHLAADFIAELRKLQEHFAAEGPFDPAYDVPYTTVHVGKLWGGTALNIVPDKAEMHFEVRHLSTADAVLAARRLQTLLCSAGTNIELETTNAYPGLDTAPDTHEAARLVNLADNKLTKVAFGTEAGIFAQMGIPTLICGPGSMEGQGHKADEFIDAQQLEMCDRLLHELILPL